MSLDVYLIGPEETRDCDCPNCGHVHETKSRVRYFEANITHNLAAMASEAGIYYSLWRPDEPYPLRFTFKHDWTGFTCEGDQLTTTRDFTEPVKNDLPF